jgi:hypothetical protein
MEELYDMFQLPFMQMTPLVTNLRGGTNTSLSALPSVAFPHHLQTWNITVTLFQPQTKQDLWNWPSMWLTS